jgi:Ca2+/Na+ antiporter
MRGIFIYNEIWVQGKTYIVIGTLLGSNILLITYVSVSIGTGSEL